MPNLNTNDINRDLVVIRDNVAFTVVGLDLVVANRIGTTIDWDNAILAYDVEDWTGTMWEDMDPGRTAIDEYRDRVMAALGI